jgi:hypothetical protein
MGDFPVMGGHRKNIAIDATDKGVARLAQSSRILCHSIQHRLNIRRRAGDHPEDVAGSSELFQRFVAFAPYGLD